MSPHPSKLAAIEAVRVIAADYANRIGIKNLTIHSAPRGDGSHYVEISDAYYYVVEDRSLEIERRKSYNLDELLYWVFESATFTVAASFELNNRRSNEDFRRQLFAKHEELLRGVTDEWGRRKVAEHSAVLALHPFNDPWAE